MDDIEESKRLMRAGRVSEAGVILLRILKETPEDLQAKMLYGICCQANGDYESFCRIGDEVNTQMESGEGIDEKRRSLWKRYCKIGLLVAGVGTAAAGGVLCFYGDQIACKFRMMVGAFDPPQRMIGDVVEPRELTVHGALSSGCEAQD